MNLIFVYGTLKRGGSNHPFLAGQAFAGQARTAPGYVLFELDGYPGMVASGEGSERVGGELWSVDDECLARLDVLECTADGLFRREEVPLEGPFADRRAEAYLYLRSTAGLRRIGPEWGG